MKTRTLAWVAAALASLSPALGRGQPEPKAKPAPAETPRKESDSDKVDRIVKARVAKIRAELAALDRATLPNDDWAREWAGSYYTGDGLGMNVSIHVAPKAGLSYTWHGCMGMYDAAVGEIVHADKSGLRVKFAELPQRDSMNFMSDTLYFVRWGDRKYLVPKRKMCTLVENFRTGGFERRQMYGIPRLGDPREHGNMFQPEPEGPPELPAAYAGQLSFRKLEVTLQSVKEDQADSGRPNTLCFHVELDKGRADGIRAQDILSYRGGKAYAFVDVETVREHSCSCLLLFFREDDPAAALPKPGDVFAYWVQGASEPAKPAKPDLNPPRN